MTLVARRVVLIVNTRSRKGRKLFRHARKMLFERGVALHGAHAVRRPADLPRMVREAVADGADFIIVGGGDGSLSCAVDHVAGKDVVFGVLPLGTANSFARTLSIPQDLEGAIDVLLNGQPVAADLGRIDGDYYANAAAIGLPAVIGQDIPHNLKSWFGRIGYLAYAAWRLARYRGFSVTLSWGDQSRTYDAVEVRIANGSYLGGIEVVEEASVDSRDLVVQVVLGRSRFALVRAWVLSALGRKPRVETLRATSFRIETDPCLPVSIDGEVLAKTPVTASVARGALKVMAPA